MGFWILFPSLKRCLICFPLKPKRFMPLPLHTALTTSLTSQFNNQASSLRYTWFSHVTIEVGHQHVWKGHHRHLQNKLFACIHRAQVVLPNGQSACSISKCCLYTYCFFFFRKQNKSVYFYKLLHKFNIKCNSLHFLNVNSNLSCLSFTVNQLNGKLWCLSCFYKCTGTLSLSRHYIISPHK